MEKQPGVGTGQQMQQQKKNGCDGMQQNFFNTLQSVASSDRIRSPNCFGHFWRKDYGWPSLSSPAKKKKKKKRKNLSNRPPFFE
jgi:hypothetical protein